MGWAYVGTDYYGRQIGYGIVATCDKFGCDNKIDRGLAYVCGEMHHGPWDADPGCGWYYCEEHRGFLGPRGGCPHRHDRYSRPWGETYCQPIGYGGRYGPMAFELSGFDSIECACGKFKADRPPKTLTLRDWRAIPGYIDHLTRMTYVCQLDEAA